MSAELAREERESPTFHGLTRLFMTLATLAEVLCEQRAVVSSGRDKN
ncbi:hypothetical protein V2K62_07010 [Pseudomonas alliivorans]|nr:hypothetical protein [Pseudomonas alliivorans]MCO5365439.1 hypothetical protein [Pseudomonas alliivorans]MEE4623244.1 hypothetical protein [Pseudomonas alliivorans]MEE4817512.1 hypothetical protein [Pseudomonas alliivorans]MEE4833484.1 hypothetical protein [Pseudomonas alliivorans]MEE4926432.1 hypothetical protein [Pseudomonas alliivorans]